jgi:hypothetical protein
MRSKNQLPGGLSLRMFANDGDDETMSPILPGANFGTTRAGQSKASGRRLRSHLEVVDRAETDDRLAARDAALQKTSGSDASWRSMLACRFLAVIKAIGGFAAHSAAALSSALLAAMSWTIAQMLAGCAEYCQAMYPTFVELDEPAVNHDATSDPQSGQRVADRLSSREPSPRGTITLLPRLLLNATSTVDAEAVDARAVRAQAVHPALARWEAKKTMEKTMEKNLDRTIERTISRSWRSSITSPVAEFWLRLRHERETRRAMLAPRAFDAPALRNAEMSRHRTENFAGIGDPRE